jgi:eukaryotic-like serine/threonine-protein kinase
LTAAVTLTAGGVALWQARLASQRFEQVRSLAGSVLFEVYDVIEPLPGSLKAQQLIVKRSVDYLDSLARDATANAELQVEAAKGFTRLGSIEGTNKLGNAKVALGYHDRALDLIRKAVAKYPKDLSVRRQYFLTLDFAGAAYEGQAQYDTAISLAEEAKRTAAETLQMFPKDADARRDLPRSQYGLAFNFARSKAHAAKALPELEAATSGWKKILDESPDDVTAMEEMAACERMMGARYFERRDYEGSRRHYSAAYEWNQKLAARDPSKLERVAFDLGQVAVTWNAVGERDKGLPMLQKQLDLRRKIMESDVANMDALRRYGVSLNRICDTYVKMKDAPKAIEFGQQAVAVQRRVYAKDPGSLLVNREYLYALVDLAHAYAIGKQKDKYCPLIREAEPLLHGPLDKTAETFADRDRKADVRMTALSCPK